jgi:hypothetical protein
VRVNCDGFGFGSDSFLEAVHAVLGAVQERLVHEVVVMLMERKGEGERGVCVWERGRGRERE